MLFRSVSQSRYAILFNTSLLGVAAPIGIGIGAASSKERKENNIKGRSAKTPKMRQGGVEKRYRMINVEGDELEIEPGTMKIVRDFKGLPPHPADEQMIDVRGNVMAKDDNMIIPKDMRYDYIYGDNNTKKDIITQVLKRQMISQYFKMGIS